MKKKENINDFEDYLDQFDEDDDFDCCSDCDLPDACADFGCAIKAGLRLPDLLI